MTRRNPPAKWVLPTIVDPPRRRCLQIEIPDEPFHVAAFRGAMLDLASAYKWADDEAHTAKQVALVWRSVIDGITDCVPPDRGRGIFIEDCMNIRLNPDDPCIIQMWCIDHWEDWYDPRGCIVKGQGSETNHGGQPAAGICQTYPMVLKANERILLPVAVSTGWTIQVSEITGIWSDNSVIWYCGDGKGYGIDTLWSCGADTPAHTGDPLMSANHMALLGLVGSTYLDISKGTKVTIPAGFTDSQIYLQPNDSDFSDNAGSITCLVKVCNSANETIFITYIVGSGPSSAQVGDTVHMTSAYTPVSDRDEIVFSVSPCIFGSVALSGWVAPPVVGSGIWQQRSCDGTYTNYSTTPTVQPYGLIQWAAGSDVVWAIDFTFLSIVP